MTRNARKRTPVKAEATSNQGQIRRLVSDWAKAIRARDMDGALANHATEVVMFDVPHPLQSKGLEAYRKTWEMAHHP